MSFFGSLFGGQNKTLSGDINQFGSIGGYATGQGESDTTAASTFWKSILSGDKSQISKALAPEISAQQGEVAQGKKTLAEFGNRSGGTTAKAASMDSTARGNITNLIGNLTNSAAGGLASTGSSLLSTGLGAYGDQVKASQIQMENWSNSILGLGITQGAGFGEGFALGKI